MKMTAVLTQMEPPDPAGAAAPDVLAPGSARRLVEQLEAIAAGHGRRSPSSEQAPAPGGTLPGRGSRDMAEEADRIAAVADRWLGEAARARILAETIEGSIPAAGLSAERARLLSPLLLAAVRPEVWHLLREEFRAEVRAQIEGDDVGSDPSERDPHYLPILIAARDEETTLARMVRSVASSVRAFNIRYPEVRAPIILCDNASRDGTPQVMAALRDELGRARIEVQLLSEPRPGKERAAKSMLRALSARERRPARVVFADADVEWTPETLTALWAHLEDHPGIEVVGGAILPRPEALGPGDVWGVLDCLPFLDFGGPEGRGLGRHMRFVSGMTYMGQAPAVERHHERIPLNMANEDIALSHLAGEERVAVEPQAVVRFQTCRSFSEFRAIKYRHVRGCYQFGEWVSVLCTLRALAADLEMAGAGGLLAEERARRVRGISRRGRREAERLALLVLDLRHSSMARSFLFERRYTPVRRSHGAPGLERGVPAFRSPTHAAAVFLFMLPAYTLSKLTARRERERLGDRQGWRPFRRREG